MRAHSGHTNKAARTSSPQAAGTRGTPRSSAALASLARPHCPCSGGCPRCTAAHDGGKPVDAGLRRVVEKSLGQDLSGVRVHTGPAAAEAARSRNANAFTTGSDIVFGREQYAPHTHEGFRRIAHELAHVVQQRNGKSGAPTSGLYGNAELEAGRAAEAATNDRSATVSMQTAGMIQHEDPPPRTFITNQPEFQLQIDPSLRPEMLQFWLRYWLGTTLAEGEPPTEAEAGTPAQDPVPQVPPPPEPDVPVAPDLLPTAEPSVGSTMDPYNLRNVPLGARDADAVMAIHRRNITFVNLLPDLRSIAPSFIRPLIPGNWRVSIAEGFTGATINAQLRHDYPTAIESFDLAWQRMTGVSTTYIPIPGFRF